MLVLSEYAVLESRRVKNGRSEQNNGACHRLQAHHHKGVAEGLAQAVCGVPATASRLLQSTLTIICSLEALQIGPG